MDVKKFKDNAPIIPYIKKYYNNEIRIEKEAGGTAFAKCLWHEERTASLAFFSKTNTFKCFGCGKHGDLIDIVMEIDNLYWEEACMEIAENTGQDIKLAHLNPDYEQYKNMMCEHADRYTNLLTKQADEDNRPEGSAWDYLIKERGLSRDTIDKFNLGLTPSNEYTNRMDVGNISDKIAFPILEHKKNGKVVGFAYRGYHGDTESSKYINDRNQMGDDNQDPRYAGVFIKGNMLYGFHTAVMDARKAGHVILTEGYFDVLSLYENGVTNAVASMGTSLTVKQIEELKRLSNNVIIMYDMDKAGRKATMNAILKLLFYNFNVAVIRYPEKDPDMLARRFGMGVKDYIMSHTESVITYLVDELSAPYRKELSSATNLATIEYMMSAGIPSDEAIDKKRMFSCKMSKMMSRILSQADVYYNAFQSKIKAEAFMRTLFKKMNM